MAGGGTNPGTSEPAPVVEGRKTSDTTSDGEASSNITCAAGKTAAKTIPVVAETTPKTTTDGQTAPKRSDSMAAAAPARVTKTAADTPSVTSETTADAEPNSDRSDPAGPASGKDSTNPLSSLGQTSTTSFQETLAAKLASSLEYQVNLKRRVCLKQFQEIIILFVKLMEHQQSYRLGKHLSLRHSLMKQVIQNRRLIENFHRPHQQMTQPSSTTDTNKLASSAVPTGDTGVPSSTAVSPLVTSQPQSATASTTNETTNSTASEVATTPAATNQMLKALGQMAMASFEETLAAKLASSLGISGESEAPSLFKTVSGDYNPLPKIDGASAAVPTRDAGVSSSIAASPPVTSQQPTGTAATTKETINSAVLEAGTAPTATSAALNAATNQMLKALGQTSMPSMEETVNAELSSLDGTVLSTIGSYSAFYIFTNLSLFL